MRCLEFNYLDIDVDRLCIEIVDCEEIGELRNREYLLAEIIDGAGQEIPWKLWCYEAGKAADDDLDDGKWWQEWSGSTHLASWCRMDSDIKRLLNLKNNRLAFEFNLKLDNGIPAVMDPDSRKPDSFGLII